MSCGCSNNNRKIVVSNSACSDSTDLCTLPESLTAVANTTQVIACIDGAPVKISTTLLGSLLPVTTVTSPDTSPIKVTQQSIGDGVNYVVDIDCPTGTPSVLGQGETVLACTTDGVRHRSLDPCLIGVPLLELIETTDATLTADGFILLGAFTLINPCACSENWCVITGELNIDAAA